MAERIIMPKQGLQMTEGTVVEWLVQEGEAVVEGRPLFTIETDKVTITIDALVSGTLLKIVAGPGVTTPITALIGVVGKPGEDISAILAEAGAVDGGAGTAVSQGAAPLAAAGVSAGGGAGTQAASSTGASLTGGGAAVAGAAKGPVDGTGGGASQTGRLFISPRAKTKAAERGIDWHGLRGSGPGGMIVERDVQAAPAVKATPLAAKTAALSGINLSEVPGTGVRGKITRDDVERLARRGGTGERKLLPMRGMRKIIAERMKQSQNENAQTCHRVSVRMDEAVRVRTAFKKTVSGQAPSVSLPAPGFNDLIALAAVRALRDFPGVNAELTAEGIWQKDFVNLGVAVAVDDGLIVPVIKDADLLGLQELSAAIKDMAEKARQGTLQPDDYSGGSFTLSNLGMFGLEEFVAIINPPEAGILAVGKIEDTPVAVSKADGTKAVEIHPVMKLTLSYDHRVVDGAPAAQFLARIKEYLENPYKLL